MPAKRNKKTPDEILAGDIIETPPAAPCDPSQQDVTEEQTAAAQEASSEHHWPENVETRDLPKEYSDADLAAKATEMSVIIKERESIKRQAKDAAAGYKAEIDALDTSLADYATDIKEGKGTERVACKWQYETSGKDGDGNFIYHPEMKTLYRVDTGAVVTVSPITPEERQMEMSLGGNPEEWSAPEEPLGLPAPGDSTAAESEDGPELEA